MNLFQVVVTAVLATLAVLALAIAAAWSLWPASAEASAAIAAHSSGWHQSAEGGLSHADHCARISSEHLQMGEAILSAALDLDDSQQSALQPVADTMEKWRAEAQRTCENSSFASLDEGLAGVENMLTLGAGAVGELRPAINNFYQSLNVEQQDKLQQLMHHHRRGKRGFGGRGMFH